MKGIGYKLRAMRDTTCSYWTQLLLQYRRSRGINQFDLADMLGVDQTTISRWERGRDVPSLGAQRRIRDLLRRETSARQDLVVRARVRHSVWPATIVRSGAIFVECNESAMREVGLVGTDMRGQSIYGHFGPLTDDVTERWERAGIFKGEVALTMSLNALETGGGAPVYIRTMDTPHVTVEGDIWCVCEVQRIAEENYRRLAQEFGGATLAVPFDNLSG
jgi:transcriptional regulator with XRE-family HTH domain